MSELQFQVDTSELDAKLARVTELATNNSKVLKEMGSALYQMVLNTFRDQTDPWGQPWADWADSTKKARQARGDYRVQKLVDTRALLNSVEVLPPDSDSIVVQAGANESEPYAAVQQFGNEKIPARPFFPMRDPSDDQNFPQDWLDNIFAPLQLALAEAVR